MLYGRERSLKKDIHSVLFAVNTCPLTEGLYRKVRINKNVALGAR